MEARYADVVDAGDAAAQNSFINRVYAWMTGALAVTGFSAYFTFASPALRHFFFGNGIMPWVLVIGTFLLVMGLSSAINRITPAMAQLGFLVYAVLNGVMLSSIFAVYELGSIGTTFFITSGTFGAMSLIGYVTKKDLTGLGALCFMALLGVIIASVVNVFVHSTTMEWIISIAGIIIFVGLTAYDTQKIKLLAMGIGTEGRSVTAKAAVLGALTLYLDFLNLFLYLLRLFGRRR